MRDLLDEKGYVVRDQTRHGLSPQGKDAGKVDISIFKEGKTYTLIEALNLSCFSMIGILGFNQILNYIELRRLMIFRMVMRKMN